MKLVERWAAWPWWLRWPALYLALALPGALAGALSVGVGNALFVLGAVAILASLGFIRLGGERKRIVSRDLKGRPVKELVPRPQRDRELAQGVGIFLVGLALWATVLVPYLLGRPL